jgi:hypothetical protein
MGPYVFHDRGELGYTLRIQPKEGRPGVIRRHSLSALLFMPYALWVSFATVLNASLVMLNAN